MNKAVATMTWIARTIRGFRYRGIPVSDHTYVVGGAVRDHLLGRPIKDVDIVIDSSATDGYDSADLGKLLARSAPLRAAENAYGVTILTFVAPFVVEFDGVQYDLRDEVIEIATAREESYGGTSGKGYKPSQVRPASIEADVYRREFTFNTLLWRMTDLTQGPDGAEVIDLSGRGLEDLQKGRMSTPSDADKTFRDDPTRMLRAIKFAARYDWQVDDAVADSIRRNADQLLNVPENAVSNLLVNDLFPYGAPSIARMDVLGLLEPIRKFYLTSTSFRSRMDGVLKSMEPVLALELIEAGLPFNEPWEGLSDDLQEVRDAIHRAKDSRALVDALQQPSRFLGSKTWFPDTAVAFGVPKRDLGAFNVKVREVVRAILVDDPNIVLDRNRFTKAVEAVLSCNFMAIMNTPEESELDDYIGRLNKINGFNTELIIALAYAVCEEQGGYIPSKSELNGGAASTASVVPTTTQRSRRKSFAPSDALPPTSSRSLARPLSGFEALPTRRSWGTSGTCTRPRQPMSVRSTTSESPQASLQRTAGPWVPTRPPRPTRSLPSGSGA